MLVLVYNNFGFLRIALRLCFFRRGAFLFGFSLDFDVEQSKLNFHGVASFFVPPLDIIIITHGLEKVKAQNEKSVNIFLQVQEKGEHYAPHIFIIYWLVLALPFNNIGGHRGGHRRKILKILENKNKRKVPETIDFTRFPGTFWWR